MVEDHPCFQAPKNKKIKLWRYMNLPKFLSLIQNNALFLCRANLLGDPFEGSLSQANIDYREFIKKNKDKEEFLAFKSMDDTTLDNFFRTRADMYKNIIPSLVVSCWHMSNYESMAMWKLYSNGEPIIAIQTNFETLESLLPKNVFLGKVHYVDYKKKFIPEDNAFYPITHKRKSFEHEKEVRAVAIDGSLCNENGKFSVDVGYGINIDIDVNKLIEKIYVDPTAPDWFYEVVQKIVKKYNLSKEVLHSSLSEQPLY